MGRKVRLFLDVLGNRTLLLTHCPPSPFSCCATRGRDRLRAGSNKRLQGTLPSLIAGVELARRGQARHHPALRGKGWGRGRLRLARAAPLRPLSQGVTLELAGVGSLSSLERSMWWV